MSAADFGALRLAVSTIAAELERITARVAELQTDPAAPYDAAVDAARQALGDAKAASLLGTDDEAAVQAAELALQSAQAAHAQTRALTQDQAAVQAGLHRLQAKAEAAHEVATQSLQTALLEWVEGEHAKANSDYVKLVSAVGAAGARASTLNFYLQSRNKNIPGRADARHFRWVPSEFFLWPSPSALHSALMAELASLGADARPKRTAVEAIKNMARRVVGEPA